MMKLRGLLVVLAALTILVPSAAVDLAASTPTPANQALLDWNAIGVQTMVNPPTTGSPPVQVNPPTFQTEGLIYMSYMQAAVYDAVTAIEGGYQPYKVSLSPPAGATSQGATIGAAYEILGTYFPAHKALRLDAAYAASVAMLPLGAADPGLAFGKDVADQLIAIRATDGRNGSNAWYSFPPAGPGAWSVPTPDNVAARTATPQTPWVAHMTPFLLESASQFRADPPPAVTSPEYAAGLNEVKAYGGQDSPNTHTLRTQAQSDIARFWTANTINQYNTLFRTLAGGKSAEDTARLLAMGNMVATDSAIACFDSKYAYSFWRPIQAIRAADTDGNPATTGDTNWTPFLAPTPNHPEYPSAHGCVTGSIANLLADWFGTNRIDVAIPGLSPTGVFGYTRTFEKVNDMTRDIADARVWAGYHYRESVVQGVNIGRKTEHYAEKHYFLPTG
jgi:hypothetical protein